MPAQLKKDGDVLKLALKGMGREEFQDALSKAKSIPGRRYNPEQKVWEFPEAALMRVVNEVHPALDAELTQQMRAEAARIAEDLSTQLPSDARLEWLEGAAKLFPFQRAAVDFLVGARRALLADDMGLGKTIEAIATVQEFRARFEAETHAWPKLIAAPSSVLGSWAAEINKWTGEPVMVVSGDKSPGRRQKLLLEFERELAPRGGWLVVNWEQLRAEVQVVADPRAKDGTRDVYVPKQRWFSEQDWLAQIADEAHRMKNRNSQIARGMFALPEAPIRLALTGTPIMNSPDELWALLAWLRPDQYEERSRTKVTYWQFFNQYVDSYEVQGRGRVVTGVKNPDALRFELADKMVRRDKAFLVKSGQLPPKLPPKHIRVELKPAQRKLYDEAEKDLWIEIERGIEEEGLSREGVNALLEANELEKLALMIPNAGARITRLRQIAVSPALLGGKDDSAKLDAVMEVVADNPDKQFGIYTFHKEAANLVVQRLRKRKITAEAITGDTPPEERTEIVKRFQAGETQIVVPTIRAGGQGITLTASDTPIFVERDWVPAFNDQAEDRHHRHGQQNTVTPIIIEAEDTVDVTNLAERIRLKESVIGATLGRDRYQEAA